MAETRQRKSKGAETAGGNGGDEAKKPAKAGSPAASASTKKPSSSSLIATVFVTLATALIVLATLGATIVSVSLVTTNSLTFGYKVPHWRNLIRVGDVFGGASGGGGGSAPEGAWESLAAKDDAKIGEERKSEGGEKVQKKQKPVGAAAGSTTSAAKAEASAGAAGSATAETKYEDEEPEYVKPSGPWKERIFTLEELAQYDGSNPDLPIYIAINGRVFDVSAGPKYYGKGGGYSFFAGKDAARAYITGCFETHLTHDLRGLSEAEIDSLKQWTSFYDNSDKYFYVGKVLHPPIPDDVPIPEPCNQ